MTEIGNRLPKGQKETGRKIEILAPAGSYAAFRAALAAGADAVYAGGPKFGARAFADNFTPEDLIRAIGEAHLFGRKFYLTVNTLLKDREMEELYDYLAPLYEAGLDAVIVQDMGVMEYVRQYFPQIDIHGSTQMTVTGAYGAKFLEKQGAVRVVPARELSLGEIRQIHEETGLEIECFVHGALCYCYSGQCLMSSMIGGRSGNRGQCAQPCRLPYTVNGTKKYYLSPKDICTLELIPDLVEAGIDSFKIEGRMKKPEYVAGVTSMYRKHTDLYLEKGRAGFRILPGDREMLMDLYNRGGFSEGYYKTHNGRDMMALDRPNHTGVPAFQVRDQRGRELRCTALTDIHPGDVIEISGKNNSYTAGSDIQKGKTVPFLVQKGVRLAPGTILNRVRNESLIRAVRESFLEKEMQLKFSGKLALRISKPGSLTVIYQDSQGRELSYTAMTQEAVQKAQNRPMDEERIRAQIRKTGNSQFSFEKLEIHMDEKIFVPVQQLNALRRAALEGLRDTVIKSRERVLPKRAPAAHLPGTVSRQAACGDSDRKVLPGTQRDETWQPVFSILVETEGQLAAAWDAVERFPQTFRRVYIDLDLAKSAGSSDSCGQLLGKLADSPAELFLSLPWIFRRGENRQEQQSGRKAHTDSVKSEETGLLQLPELAAALGADGVLIRNYEEYQFLMELGFDKKIILDHNLYVFNHYGRTFWEKVHVFAFTAPQELNAGELEGLGIRGMELPVYGHLPVMVSAQCTLRTAGRCRGIPEVSFLTDRLGNRFPVKNQCTGCYNVILNTRPLYLGTQKESIRRLAPGTLRVQFSIETEERARRILDLVQEAFCGERTPAVPDFEYTQGHFRRGVS